MALHECYRYIGWHSEISRQPSRSGKRPEEREKKMEFSFYKGTAINKGGVMPYIDPCTATAYFTAAALENRVDNITELDRPGINHIIVSVLPDRWHIEQVGGYSYEDGLFTIVCA